MRVETLKQPTTYQIVEIADNAKDEAERWRRDPSPRSGCPAAEAGSGDARPATSLPAVTPRRGSAGRSMAAGSAPLDVAAHCAVVPELVLNAMSKIITISEARRGLFQLVRDLASGIRAPVTLSGKDGDAVLVSLADWDALQETLFLQSIPGMREDIIDGINADLEDLTSAEDLGLLPSRKKARKKSKRASRA